MDSSERRETVTALAVRAKTDRAVIPALWSVVERFIQSICIRYCRASAGTNIYELDDLCQAAYFGFIKAIDTFDPSKRAFSTHLSYYIRKSCHLEVTKCRNDPINSALSLDKPLDDTNGITFAETLADPHAPEAFEAVDLHMLVDVILAEVKKIPDIRQRRIIRECTYQGRTLSSFAEEIGISREGARAMEERAITWLRRNMIIRGMYSEYRAEVRATKRTSETSPYRKKSVTTFNSDFTSVVEAVILSMDWRERCEQGKP